MPIALLLLEAAVLASSLSLDAFVASFAYGSNRIKIPLSSVAVIDLVCSGFLGVSLLLGSAVRPYLSPEMGKLVCFVILFAMGLVKLLDDITKSMLRRYGELSKDFRFSLLSFRFVLSIYADPEKADADHSKSISSREAFSLAVALSLDGMAVGFGAALGQVNGWVLFAFSLAAGAAAVLLGDFLGTRLAARLRFPISWLSGALLILLAFCKIL